MGQQSEVIQPPTVQEPTLRVRPVGGLRRVYWAVLEVLGEGIFISSRGNYKNCVTNMITEK